ncbi:MAG: amino acid permease [Calditrichaeota bacterium]|nr:amino acid permease [Calditrichota bacterium]
MNHPKTIPDRKLGIFSATSIVVANMIGTGIFTTTGILAGYLPGNFWILACWFLGGLIALSGALCYSELATRMPHEGGEYIYLKNLYHPMIGFLTGWTSFFVGFSAPIAAAAISFSSYILAGLNTESTALNPELLKTIVAITTVIIFTLVHYLGIRLGSGIQNILTILKVLIIISLSAAGIMLGSGNLNFISFSSPESGSLMGISVAMIIVMFSYSGWNASTYIAGELKNPRRTLPFSLITGTIIVIILYLSINLFIIKEIPYSEMINIIPVVEIAAVKSMGQWIGKLVGLLIAIALLSSLSAFILIGPRVYYAMALDKLFFPFASRLHPRYKVPGSSIVIQGILAIIMILAGTFEQLLIYMGFALSVFPWLSVYGLFIARKKKIGADSAVEVWGYPVIPVFFLVSSSALMIATFIHRPVESIAALITISAGIPLYLLWTKNIAKAKT